MEEKVGRPLEALITIVDYSLGNLLKKIWVRLCRLGNL
jgi:hypothetical protein